ncbi:hypothetical protein F0Q45_04990 [Mycobacterium simiae]|uniref:Uncharacterized protein n=1 Tax=Mycobacterium simiae TaxID=1784 RepID=A0A5B1BVG8_MYCSI|nr:hypothetical protein [Mycobacterium simiae]KAA1251333.1 hypothetical protein F0Q45_04990 [Mycobacterium simiae]
MRLVARFAAVGVVVTLACSGGSIGKSSKKASAPSSTPTPSVQINGDASNPVNQIVIKAITGIQGFRSSEFS